MASPEKLVRLQIALREGRRAGLRVYGRTESNAGFARVASGLVRIHSRPRRYRGAQRRVRRRAVPGVGYRRAFTGCGDGKLVTVDRTRRPRGRRGRASSDARAVVSPVVPRPWVTFI